LEDNLAEGIVIKTVESLYFSAGGRACLKKKIDKFSERVRLDKVKKPQPLKVEKEEEKLPKELEGLYLEVLTFLTKNRLNNVISKIGLESAQKDTIALAKLFASDIMDDWRKENEEKYQVLNDNQRRNFDREINKDAFNFVVEYFQKEEDS
jgi:hypothetical protein